MSWAVNAGAAQFGADAELKTAQLLNQHAMRDNGPTVFHDIRIPIPGFKANLDHIVVAGHKVLIIDTKAWKGGFMWTLGGTTRRGLTRFVACDKKTIVMGHQRLDQVLNQPRHHADFATPLVVVWPTGQKPLSTWAATFPGARIVTSHQLEKVLARMHGPADPFIEQQLTALCNGIQRRQPTWRQASGF